MHSNLSPTGRFPSQPEIQRIATELSELRVQLQKLREARGLPAIDFSALEARMLQSFSLPSLYGQS